MISPPLDSFIGQNFAPIIGPASPRNSNLRNPPAVISETPSSPRMSVRPPTNISSGRLFNHQDFDRVYRDRMQKVSGNDIETGYQDKGKYRGTVVSGMRSGRGQYMYPNGDGYNGLWTNDKFSGIGSYNFNKLGQTYYGDFQNHFMHGNGTLVRNGTKQVIYEGNWQNGLKHGLGTQFYSSNPLEYYEGNWVSGNKQGMGSHFKDGNVYKGEWQNGKKHGRGDFQTKNGIIYSGLWNHDTMDSGTIKYPKGDTYEGQIVNGLRQGKGRYVYGDGQVYEGQYMNDLKHGQGVEKKGNVLYNGNFVNDLCHGYGTLIAANGDKYQGQFYEGRKQGPNSFYSWKDGSTFRGSFENDQMWEGTFIDIKDNIPRTVKKGQVINM